MKCELLNCQNNADMFLLYTGSITYINFAYAACDKCGNFALQLQEYHKICEKEYNKLKKVQILR